MWHWRHGNTRQRTDEEATALTTGATSQESFFAELGLAVQPHDITVKRYLTYLNHRFSEIAPHIINVLNVDGLSSESCPQRPSERLLEFLTLSIPMVANQRSLAQTVAHLRGAGLLHARSEDDCNSAIQLLFISFGLLTCLYEPELDPPKHTLLIRKNQICSRPTVWTTDTVQLDANTSRLEMSGMLRRFSGRQGPITVPQPISDVESDRGHLRVSNVSFYTLTNFIQLEIVWTASACQHLEFDMRNKRLHLFRLPSLCCLFCAGSDNAERPQISFLDKFFGQYLLGMRQLQDLHAATAQASPGDSARQFYREILESYRLIFGQEERAQKAFRRSALGRKLRISRQEQFRDELLYQLCSQPWDKQEMYDTIDAGPAKLVYNASFDFPFFAERWMQLQDYVLSQAPNDWRSLYRDSRDPERFVAIWAVVGFGILTLMFSVIQIGISAAQLGLQAAQNGAH